VPDLKLNCEYTDKEYAVTWINITNPYADDGQVTSPPTRYQQNVAAHSLEALSTAAAGDQTTYPPQGTAYYTAVNPQTDAHPEYGFVQADPAPSAAVIPSTTQSYTVGTSPLRQTDPLIDPNLEVAANNGGESMDKDAKVADKSDGPGSIHHENEIAETEAQVAMALRSYNALQSS
jgi:hypothetical protein